MNRRTFLKISAFSMCNLLWSNSLLSKNRTPKCALNEDAHIKDYLNKMEHFDQPHPDDIYVEECKYALFESVVHRLVRLQKLVGYGNYHLLSFDEAIGIAKDHSVVDEFPKAELDFMEEMFFRDMSSVGFLDQKPVENITEKVNKRDVIKIPASGNFLYKGAPLETYEKIINEIGDQAVLTSGIRGVMKQFLLFFGKAYANQANLSLASRSLAPPGYSFHGVGDFDIGQYGFGIHNFTARFTTTEVYKKLRERGYLKLRYPENNLVGVRFEPWHIKI